MSNLCELNIPKELKLKDFRSDIAGKDKYIMDIIVQ